MQTSTAVRRHPEYAPPVIRAPSPASSIGTIYGEDQTSFSDKEEQLSPAAFEKKWEERLGLGQARREEDEANRDPLIPRAPEGSDEETKLFEETVGRLRDTVHTVEEDELFDETLLRGSVVALEPQSGTVDVDALMRSMMVVLSPRTCVASAVSESVAEAVGQGMRRVGRGRQVRGGSQSGLVPGKRSRNGTRRN